jgi:hypothetical protein
MKESRRLPGKGSEFFPSRARGGNFCPVARILDLPASPEVSERAWTGKFFRSGPVVVRSGRWPLFFFPL